jgi:hypothetical protein
MIEVWTLIKALWSYLSSWKQLWQLRKKELAIPDLEDNHNMFRFTAAGRRAQKGTSRRECVRGERMRETLTRQERRRER